jgi:hypothetical protein
LVVEEGRRVSGDVVEFDLNAGRRFPCGDVENVRRDASHEAAPDVFGKGGQLLAAARIGVAPWSELNWKVDAFGNIHHPDAHRHYREEGRCG